MLVGGGGAPGKEDDLRWLVEQWLMKRFPSAPFQIRCRIDLVRRDIRAAQTRMAMERKSIPAIL